MTAELADAIARILEGAAVDGDEAAVRAALDAGGESRDEVLSAFAMDAALRTLGDDASAYVARATERISGADSRNDFARSALESVRAESVRITRRKRAGVILRYVALGAAAAVVLAALFGPGGDRTRDVPTITGFTGSVTADGEAVTRGERAPLDVPIEVGAASSLLLAYDDGTTIEVDAGSTLRIGHGASKAVVLVHGGFRSSIEKQPPGAPMRFTGTDAEITVIGTELDLAAGVDGIMVGVNRGRVRLVRTVPTGGEPLREAIELGAGKAALAERGAPLATVPFDPQLWAKTSLALRNGEWATVVAHREAKRLARAALPRAPEKREGDGEPVDGWPIEYALDGIVAKGKDLVGLDWKTLAPYYKKQRHYKLGAIKQTGTNPHPWSSNVWDEHSVGEVAIVKAPGREVMAWRIRNLSGRHATQLMLWRPFVMFRNATYQFSFRYRTTADVYVRWRLGRSGVDSDTVVLPPNPDGWRTVAATIETGRLPEALSLNFQHNRVGEEHAAYITEVRLVRVDDARPALDGDPPRP